MKIDEIRDTITWKYLMNHPKFLEVFNEVIKRCSFYMNINDLIINVSDKKMIISYNSNVRERELDCQYKLYNRVELSMDDENNLIINELSGSLESNYGYSFKDTSGGRLNTHYSCQVYDRDGIEVSYQSYGDRYNLDSNAFNIYKEDFSSVIKESYNPKLIDFANKTGVYCHPNIIGRDGRFLRQIRSHDNLGIVEVSKCSFNNNSVVNPKEEYYFNTFFGSNSSRTPEMMHLITGFPFATIEKDNSLKFKDDYIKLGINPKNFRLVAKERFLKELKEQKDRYQKDSQILDKYELMIKKIENELDIGSKTM